MLDGRPIGGKRQRALVFYGRLVGSGYLTLAILGLLMTGLTPFAPSEGDELFIFSVNPLTNLIHLVVCLTVVQSSSYVLLLAIGYLTGAQAPIFADIPSDASVVDPVVQALTLTDVVVEARSAISNSRTACLVPVKPAMVSCPSMAVVQSRRSTQW